MANSRPIRATKAASKHGLRHKAGIALLRRAAGGKEVLLVQQTNGQWSLPKGRCRPGEAAKDACLRECYEETGYNPTKVVFVSSGTNSRKTVRLYLWKSNVPGPYRDTNGMVARQNEIRRIAWFNPGKARNVLKSWQWNLLAKVFR